MAVTRLERKGRKNKSVAKLRVSTIKRLSQKPVIKKIDVEAIREEFEKKSTLIAKAEKAVPKKEEVKAEPTVATEQEEPKAGTKADPKQEDKDEAASAEQAHI